MRRLFVLVLVLGCGPGQERASAPSPDSTPSTVKPDDAAKASPSREGPTPRACLATFEVDSERSVLEEQRRRGGAKRWDDFPSRYGAAYLEPETQAPVEVVRSIQIGETPLLWFTSDFGEAVVNAAVLTELKLVDVPRLGVDERVEIGTLTELGRGKIQGRELLRFLVMADVVRTYWHIGSTVCLLAEEDGEAGYRAEASGEHVYFTNEENRDPFGFVLTVDPEGRISITGAEPVPFSAGAADAAP